MRGKGRQEKKMEKHSEVRREEQKGREERMKAVPLMG